METFADKSINLFLNEMGGNDFLGLFFGSLIIIAIILALIRPFDF